MDAADPGDCGVVEVQPGLRLTLIRTGVFACPYLSDRFARLQFSAEPIDDAAVYQLLMDAGFRRNGFLYYRPSCPRCRACVPIRVPVSRFRPSRSQRRTWRRNQDVQVTVGPLSADHERYELYCRYQRTRHNERQPSSWDEFRSGLCGSAIHTLEFAYRLSGRLVGVGIVDACPDALSSVYFYYDPELHRRGLGIFSSMCEIAECRRRGLAWWYIGYYVAGSRKMEYKQSFRPHELLGADGVWRAAH